MEDHKILSVEDLKVWFYVRKGISKIVNGINFSVRDGELFGLVGESGSGKTVLANALLGYVREPGRIVEGEVDYRGVNLRTLNEEELIKRYRGKEIGFIASNARIHLNPLRRVGDLIADVYMAHNEADKKEAYNSALNMLQAVGINDPERRIRAFPHELSGGMAQRIMIAMVLVNSPRLLIADDCTNGLDVTVAAQVMDLFAEMVNRTNSSGIMITHDLGLIAQYCKEVAIMYCGQIIESGPVATFFKSPTHPYSIRLLSSLPEKRIDEEKMRKIGNLPNPLELPEGCFYHPRCEYATDVCAIKEPPMFRLDEKYYVKCFDPISRSAINKMREEDIIRGNLDVKH